MSRLRLHTERHLVSRVGWLRAAVLGANDGIVSTASLIVGVAAAAAAPSDVLITGIAGLVAGAMSMAAGEYVSVSSQSDTEQADLARERKELADSPELEREELANIYRKRGLDQDLALRVADQLMAVDALGAHAHDELGISDATTARPVQAALTSAGTFSVGAAARRRGVRIGDLEAGADHVLDEVDGGAGQIELGHGIDKHHGAVLLDDQVVILPGVVKGEVVAEARAAAAIDGDAQRDLAAIVLDQGGDAPGGAVRDGYQWRLAHLVP